MNIRILGSTFLAIGLILIFVGLNFGSKVASSSVEPPLPSSTETCPDSLQESELKGCLFEQWVKQRFNKQVFFSEAWNKSGSLDNTLTGSGIPDFYYRVETETQKEHFYVECVYRSSINHNELSWGSDEKVANLNTYALNTQDPVFLVLGVGGKPDMPNNVRIVKITGDTPGTYSAIELPKARKTTEADFKFDPVTKMLF